MFQYAAGKALAVRTGGELKLDLGNCAPGAYRPYRLDVFGVRAEPAHESEIPFEFRQSRQRSLMHRARRRLRRLLLSQPAVGRHVIREMGFAFDDSVISASGDKYLVGYWQSPKYFEDAADVIRSDFALTADQVGVSAGVMSDLARDGTVSVHVRRGDYVTDPVSSSYHGVCSTKYYTDALELLSDRLDVRKVFVFSDDIEWARSELRFAAPTVLMSESGGASDIADFFLMSQCEHHVIANSSFSWWAAWLGRRRDGCVVSPRHWFTDSTIDTGDLRPPGWLMA